LARADGTPVIRRVYVGVSEPETFVGVNLGRRRLTEAGIEVVHVAGLEEAILQVATAGHERKEEGS
jgi:pyrimidine deaminase RibD-like protein